MKLNLPSGYRIHPEVARALSRHQAVVALESAVVTHGLPHPINLDLARQMEEIVKETGATPATIALLNGEMVIGITDEELQALSTDTQAIKVSPRNIGIGIARGSSGGTTVAATLIASRTAGIRVFATGGIGGVHRGHQMDVSADLDELARSPVIVVCSGAKSILDLPATLEALETRGVPVLGYKTDEFPAFYTRSSGLKVDVMVDTPDVVKTIAVAHWHASNRTALVVANPLPPEASLDADLINAAIESAVQEAGENGVTGAKVTPFLLSRVSELTGQRSLEANLLLLKNNARLAGEIAATFSVQDQVSF